LVSALTVKGEELAESLFAFELGRETKAKIIDKTILKEMFKFFMITGFDYWFIDAYNIYYAAIFINLSKT
jgi:hypothetical protein